MNYKFFMQFIEPGIGSLVDGWKHKIIAHDEIWQYITVDDLQYVMHLGNVLGESMEEYEEALKKLGDDSIMEAFDHTKDWFTEWENED